MNQQLYEQKREEKTKERLSENSPVRGGWKKKIIFIFAGIFILVGIGWLVMSLAVKGPDYSKTYPDQGRDHIADGASHDPYNSNPPTSGPHYVEWAMDRFYERAIPDEHLVHNLEHGDIWISYKPSISDDVKKRLKKIAGSKVVVTPREANTEDIALMAWTHLDSFNIENGTLDTVRIKDFIKRYKNRGPERVMTSGGGKEF
ncbi:MAG: DUF3105 domain-containing protein [Patescibacteria group bacterium]